MPTVVVSHIKNRMDIMSQSIFLSQFWSCLSDSMKNVIKFFRFIYCSDFCYMTRKFNYLCLHIVIYIYLMFELKYIKIKSVGKKKSFHSTVNYSSVTLIFFFLFFFKLFYIYALVFHFKI